MPQTTGPQVAAKEAMNSARQTSVMVATGSDGLDGSERERVEMLRTAPTSRLLTIRPFENAFVPRAS